MLAIVPVLGGLLIGFARGGRLRHLAGLRVRAVIILWIIAALQLACLSQPRLSSTIQNWLGVSPLVLVFGLAGVWVLLNIRGRSRAVKLALLLILLGGAMNATAIALNGTMPYSGAASGGPVERNSPNHMPMNADTKLPWLTDIVPVYPLRADVSVGDLILLLGVGVFAASATEYRPVRTA